MFEVSGVDISLLGDSDLRSLVIRLALSELKAKGYPLSSLTAGGNQDAADGGIDVRVECPSPIATPDFVQRRHTGFQVKRTDMPAGAINDEMRPNGSLREVIQELANNAGSYVIISSQGSVADKPLADRRAAMKLALTGINNASQLHTDFYDRDRLSIWVNQYPGIAAWVLTRIGRPTSGWSGINDWNGNKSANSDNFLSDDETCLVDESSREPYSLTLTDGIKRLRDLLNQVGQCIRLVGLSGVGKTRLVQALFDDRIPGEPLDSGITVYTDYSEEPTPTAREMARMLIDSEQRAILVVDNCNPKTHSELSKLCAAEASNISLITVEYDVQEDEPEHTKVFRLHSASIDLLREWLKRSFPGIAEPDRIKIAEFSDGNFRVAEALSRTLDRGETLGTLRSRALFERIFHQRNQADGELLRAAEDLSLLYSIDGEDTSTDGELAKIQVLRGAEATSLYGFLVEMRKRGVVQARGRHRAILPQAIANPLAAQALEKIPPINFDRFFTSLNERMQTSASRRLGYLHESSAAQSTVKRWLAPNGPLGNLFSENVQGFQVVKNIAPVAPEAVLERLEQETKECNTQSALRFGRHPWIGLIKSLGYEAKLFDRVVTLLTKILACESHEFPIQPALETFEAFFHLYFSGTQASPKQRHSIIKRLSSSSDSRNRHLALVALRALLKTQHFTFSDHIDFGARPRNWGWEPKIYGDMWNWFGDAINLIVELAPDNEARELLADSARELWQHPTCQDLLDRIADNFSRNRPWVEGWVAFRAILKLDGKNMSSDSRGKLEAVISKLKPEDLLNRARAIVLHRQNGSWYLDDGDDDEDDAKPWKKAAKMAEDIGRELCDNAAVRAEFLNELWRERHADRAYDCGIGLAKSSPDLSQMWQELATSHGNADKNIRNPTVLCGFIAGAKQCDNNTLTQILNGIIDNTDLSPILPRLHSRIGVDAEGIERLRQAIAQGKLVAESFQAIANSAVSNSPPSALVKLLNEMSFLPNGIAIALEILHMHFHGRSDEDQRSRVELTALGRNLLAKAPLTYPLRFQYYTLQQLIDTCFDSNNSIEYVKKAGREIQLHFGLGNLSHPEIGGIVQSLFRLQPRVALDTLLLSPDMSQSYTSSNENFPIESIDILVLDDWAQADPQVRYPILSDNISMFKNIGPRDESKLSDLFLKLLDRAPDKHRFLGDYWNRIHPRSGSGSFAQLLKKRMNILGELDTSSHEEVRKWVSEARNQAEKWISFHVDSDRAREVSFE